MAVGLLPTQLELIEKHVMVSINQEFNEHFRKWFGLLVEDSSKEARVDEDLKLFQSTIRLLLLSDFSLFMERHL